MANEQAFNQVDINMRIIEQNTAALKWLEEHRVALTKGAPESAYFKINQHQVFGGSFNGFKEAEMVLNSQMKVHSLALVDGAIANARSSIKTAEEQVKEWSQRL